MKCEKFEKKKIEMATFLRVIQRTFRQYFRRVFSRRRRNKPNVNEQNSITENGDVTGEWRCHPRFDIELESDNNGSDDEEIELSQSLVEDMNSSNILTLEEIPSVDVERRKTIIEVLRTLNIISQHVSERIMETPMPSPIRRNV